MRISIRTTAGRAAEDVRRLADDVATLPVRALPALQRTALEIQRRNLESEGRSLGVTWPELRPSTVAERLRRGYAASPRLKRTGALWRSLRAESAFGRVRITSDHRASFLDQRFRFLGWSEGEADQVAELIAAHLDEG